MAKYTLNILIYHFLCFFNSLVLLYYFLQTKYMLVVILFCCYNGRFSEKLYNNVHKHLCTELVFYVSTLYAFSLTDLLTENCCVLASSWRHTQWIPADYVCGVKTLNTISSYYLSSYLKCTKTHIPHPHQRLNRWQLGLWKEVAVSPVFCLCFIVMKVDGYSKQVLFMLWKLILMGYVSFSVTGSCNICVFKEISMVIM